MTALDLDPVPTLLARVREELGASFDPARPIRVGRAPGRLDVMGGITDYTGGLVCQMPLSAGTAVALQARDDRQVSVFSFNLLDDHRPFQFGINLDALARATADELRRELSGPGRAWAGYVVGCLFILHEKGHLDLSDPRRRGVNVAVYTSLPVGGGVASSAALEVAAMTAFIEHYRVMELAVGTESRAAPRGRDLNTSRSGRPIEATGPRPGEAAATGGGSTLERAMRLAALCQQVENRLVGAPCGIMDQVACMLGEPGKLLRLVCQPHTLLPPLALPVGVRVLGIDTGVRHGLADGAFGRTRAAAFMGHAMIVNHMRRLGREAGKQLVADPTGGYLANLDPDDYKAFFRAMLPEAVTGREHLDRFGPHGDPATTIDPVATYTVQAACDHHVLEARRVRRFAGFLERANIVRCPVAALPSDAVAPHNDRAKALRSAGRLMHASHKSYTDKAGLGHAVADMLIQLVREHEHAGLYGARITGGGAGGTVAVLADDSPRAGAALTDVMSTYRERTGHEPTMLAGSSPGAAYVPRIGLASD